MRGCGRIAERVPSMPRRSPRMEWSGSTAGPGDSGVTRYRRSTVADLPADRSIRPEPAHRPSVFVRLWSHQPERKRRDSYAVHDQLPGGSPLHTRIVLPRQPFRRMLRRAGVGYHAWKSRPDRRQLQPNVRAFAGFFGLPAVWKSTYLSRGTRFRTETRSAWNRAIWWFCRMGCACCCLLTRSSTAGVSGRTRLLGRL